jgi:hypothetical protein
MNVSLHNVREYASNQQSYVATRATAHECSRLLHLHLHGTGGKDAGGNTDTAKTDVGKAGHGHARRHALRHTLRHRLTTDRRRKSDRHAGSHAGGHTSGHAGHSLTGKEHALLALLLLGSKSLVDKRDDTTTSNSSLDKRIKLLITTDSELEVTGSDTLHLVVASSVTGKLHDLGTEVLEDSSSIHSSSSTDTVVRVNTRLEETVDTTDRELETSTLGTGDGLGLARLGLALTGLTLTTLATFSFTCARL